MSLLSVAVCVQFEVSQQMLRDQAQALQAVAVEQKGMQLMCNKGHARASGLASSTEALRKGESRSVHPLGRYDRNVLFDVVICDLFLGQSAVDGALVYGPP